MRLEKDLRNEEDHGPFAWDECLHLELVFFFSFLPFTVKKDLTGMVL